MMGSLKFKNNHFLIQMDRTDKTQKGSPAFIVKVQHKKLRTKFLKNPKNSKLIWEQVLKNADNLKEYASAMDILSRNWTAEGDGIRNVAKNKLPIERVRRVIIRVRHVETLAIIVTEKVALNGQKTGR